MVIVILEVYTWVIWSILDGGHSIWLNFEFVNFCCMPRCVMFWSNMFVTVVLTIICVIDFALVRSQLKLESSVNQAQVVIDLKLVQFFWAQIRFELYFLSSYWLLTSIDKVNIGLSQ